MTFKNLAIRVADAAGRPVVFILAVCTVVVWAALGPLLKFSDAWQLTINTGTTIITFLMVFLIQASQNKDTKEIQLKLAELIRAHKGARNRFAHLEDATEEELQLLIEEFKRLRE